ncbi:hypothetical protein B296_00002291 [Ensete ventricosum]|uniref:Uncharacterized protein n=1 Tax=Ensete ventricosum TaxID=4639 RepID=A0A427BBP3_ENSVE|nr:hypothetical protein B296_00002291 [Ensete ventricosum]
MGFLFRVRLASFFAGAATASIAGFYLLYRDYMLSHDAIAQQVGLSLCYMVFSLSVDACFFQVNGIYGTLDERYEALNRRVTALETQKAEATESAGASG